MSCRALIASYTLSIILISSHLGHSFLSSLLLLITSLRRMVSNGDADCDGDADDAAV